MEAILDLGIDELDHDFAEILQSPGHVAGGGFGRLGEQPQEERPQSDREQQGIHMHHPKTARFLSMQELHLGKIEPEIGQVVDDIPCCGMTSFAHSVLTEASNVKGNASQYAISAAMYANRRGSGETSSHSRAMLNRTTVSSSLTTSPR